jgi:hypothetical protein
MAKLMGTLALAFAATLARAQGGTAGEPMDPAERGQAAAQQQRAEEGEIADACVAAIRGERPSGAPDDLSARCERLIRAGEAGTGRGEVGPGQSVRAAFTEAGNELIGRGPTGGMASRRGPTGNTLVTNPIGWFSGLGVNAEYQRVVEDFPRVSWLVGGRFSRTDATNGEVSAFGLGGGLDLFVIGGRNEGLRVGPRLELAFGTEDIQGSTTFGRVGASGEVGYNFIATNGITAEGAVGLGGRLAGDSKNDGFASFTGGDFGPYVKLGVGLSW